jgi:ATP-binding cassette subfamily C protein/ATP-binding cassette subfamily C protein CydC
MRGGDVMTRLVSDVDAVQDLLVRCLLPAGVAVVTAGGAVTLTAVLLPLAGAVLAGGLSLAVLAVPAAAHLALRHGVARVAASRAELATRGLDLVDGASELAAYGAEAAALAAADAAARRLAQHERACSRVASAAGAAILALQAGATIGVTLLAAAAGPAPILVPVLALTCLTTFEVAAPLPAAARHLIDVTAAACRLAELFDARPEVSAPTAAERLGDEPVTAELSGARVRYAPDRPPALDAVDLRIEPGKRVALAGPSGSGKSTVLAALGRFVGIESGSYRVNGHDAARLAPRDVRARLAGATQDAYVFHASLRDNLALARPEATEQELLDAARRASLSGWIESLPGGLDTVVGHDGASMSGGQRQRLVLVRALLADPDVLLLDEPVEGLDPPTAAAVLTETLDATNGRTVVLVTHDLGGLDAVDEVVSLDAGRVAPTMGYA